MLSKRELKEKYEELFKTPSFALRADFDQKKFSEAYLKKARHNLELAGLLDLLSRDGSVLNLASLRGSIGSLILVALGNAVPSHRDFPFHIG